MNNEQIINLYFSRDQQAITETDAQYGAYCHQIALRILNNPLDAEETVSDTWLRAWDSIPPNHPSNLKLYLARITRNLAFSRYRSATAQKRGGTEAELALEELAGCIGSGESIDDGLNKAELTSTIQDFLTTLSDQHRHIFIRRYFFVEPISLISNMYGLKTTNVLMILSRVRKKLKEHLIKEGYDL